MKEKDYIKMPFTPLHFGVHSFVALMNPKRINILVFVLANVIIDLEPLLVMFFRFDYPLHGYAHTFLGAIIIGGIWGVFSYKAKKIYKKLLYILKLPGDFSLKEYIISAITGTLLHVFFDSPLYLDIKPFYPLENNLFYGFISNSGMYKLCGLFFISAIIIYVWIVIKYSNKKNVKDT